MLHRSFSIIAILGIAALCACGGGTLGDGDGDGGTGGKADAGSSREPDARPVKPGVDARPPKPGEPDAAPPMCQGNGGVAQPFGNHAQPYAAGVIQPDVPQREMDDAVAAFYDEWKSRYLKSGCGGNYVEYIPGGQTVSEAHGYGMVLTALMAGHDPQARALFDGLYRFYEGHRSDIQRDLMAWKQQNCRNVSGANSASDGDLDIAYALLLADKQWGSGGAIKYGTEAQRIIAGIMEGDVDDSGGYILLGDWAQPGSSLRNVTRSSDFMPGHLASFAAAAGAQWKELLDSEYTIMRKGQALAPSTGLLPDFLVDPLGTPALPEGEILENPTDDDFSYNACRDPWRIATHFVTSGDSRAKQLVQKMNGWVKSATAGDPTRIKAGYTLSGTPLNNYVDMAFTAPFGVAAMVDASHQEWLNGLWDFVVDADPQGYYGDSIKLMSMIVMSGNWWRPEAAPCQ